MAKPENSEFELKLSVPRAARAQVVAEVTRGAGFQGRQSLAAMYLDTAAWPKPVWPGGCAEKAGAGCKR